MNTVEKEARDRMLSWALHEIAGTASPTSTGWHLRGRHLKGGHLAAQGQQDPTTPPRMLRALLLAAGLTVGTGIITFLLTIDSGANDDDQMGQDRRSFRQVRSAADIDRLPPTTTAVKGFDLTDRELGGLARLKKLAHLDLSGMEVNAKGHAVQLSISDAAFALLGKLTTLESLSVQGCAMIRGPGLQELARIPGLRELNVGGTRIDGNGIRAIAALASLRRLDLSRCVHFSSRSLRSLVKLEGLEWLSLDACHQLRSVDLATLKKLKRLRHLDLRAVNGRFVGSTSRELPVEGNGVGVDDSVLRAIATLDSLESLNLSGCHGYSKVGLGQVAKLHRLVRLDVSGNPSVDAAILSVLPRNVHYLGIASCPNLDATAWTMLKRFRRLRELDLSGASLTRSGLSAVLEGTELQALKISNVSAVDPDTVADLARESSLTSVDLSENRWLTDRHLQAFAKIAPSIHRLRMWSCPGVTDGGVRALLSMNHLRHLELRNCRQVTEAGVRGLRALPLAYLDVFLTGADQRAIQAMASSWPRSTIMLPKGQTLVVPKR